MDSAAAYSMTLPDEGAARWTANCVLAVCVHAILGFVPRNVFRLYSVSGSGSARIDWGDGSSETVALPGSASHSYSREGAYVVAVTGDGLSDIRLSDGETVGSSPLDAAPVDVLRITVPAPSTAFPHFPPTGRYIADGVRDWRWSPRGWPSEIVVQGVSSSLRFDPYDVYNHGTVFASGLTRFYAPGVTGFSSQPGTGNMISSRPPFAGCMALEVLYLPAFTTIPFSCFVSPSARGVKVHVGRLTSVNAQAFTNVNPSTGQAIVSGNPVAGCSVELFCGNASSEILALGFPFGADYLKCHCTDMTFDSFGYRFRESDGRRYDPENGQLVNDDFKYVDEAGHLVKYHEGLARWIACDEYGFYVDGDELPYDPETGFWIDRDRHVCDESGRKCDVFGTHVDYKYWNPSSETDPASPRWVADDNSGGVVDWTEQPRFEDGRPFRQFVVGRLGEKISVREEVNLGNGSYGDGDPRANMYKDVNNPDEGIVDYFDARGYLRAREMINEGAVYAVEYDGNRLWHLVPYGSQEEFP